MWQEYGLLGNDPGQMPSFAVELICSAWVKADSAKEEPDCNTWDLGIMLFHFLNWAATLDYTTKGIYAVSKIP